jgi:predicted  nucleic acid-binding Zn-ribbon protein
MHAAEQAAVSAAKEAAVKETAVLKGQLRRLEEEFAEARKAASSEGSSVQKQLQAVQSECETLQNRLDRVQKVWL